MSELLTDHQTLSLELKLQLLAQGMEIGLTAAEAAVYGVEDADILEDEGLEEGLFVPDKSLALTINEDEDGE